MDLVRAAMFMAVALALCAPAAAAGCPGSPLPTCPYDSLQVFGASAPGDVHDPRAVAVAPNGELLVIDEQPGNGTIMRLMVFDAQGSYLRDLAPPNHAWVPRYVTAGPDGTVFGLDLGGGNVSVFRPDGSFAEWTAPGADERMTSDRARMEAIEAAPDGTLWLADRAARLWHVDAQGNQLAGPFQIPGGEQDFQQIHALPDGTLLAGVQGGIAHLSATGDVLARFPASIGPAITTDALGRIYTAAGSTVLRYESDGSGQTTLISDLANTGGIALASPDSLLVADSDHHRLVLMGLDGSVRTTFGEASPGTLNHPRAVWAAADGGFVVADERNFRLAHFGPSGDFLGRVDGGDEISAWGGVLDPLSGEYVVRGPGNVFRFAQDGTKLGTWPAPDQGTSYSSVQSVAAAADGSLYVNNAGTQNGGEVVKYSATGSELGRFSGPASGPGHIDRPGAIAVAPNGEVYVASSGVANRAIDVFSPDGEFRRSLGDACSWVQSIAIDEQGLVYVGTYGRVFIVSPDQSVIGAFGAGDFKDTALGWAPGDNLLIADAGNSRVVRVHIDRAALRPIGKSPCMLSMPIPFSQTPAPLAPQKLIVRKSVARVPVACPRKATRRCRGDVRISVAAHAARAPFRLARGQRVKVGVKLRGKFWSRAIKNRIPVALRIRMRGAATITTTTFLVRGRTT